MPPLQRERKKELAFHTGKKEWMSSGDKSSLAVSFSRVPNMETTKLSIRSTCRRVSRVETALRM